MNDSSTPQPGGLEECFARLKARGLSLEQVVGLLAQLRIEPVFTPHPTESTRRTLLRQRQRIARLLTSRLDPSLTPGERRSIIERVRTELTTGWQTAGSSRERLSVADEREHVLFFLVEVIYEVIPGFYEEVEAALTTVFGEASAAVHVPEMLFFGSWVGGDMDGHPDVHAKTIRESCARHHQLIVNRYFLEAQALAERLSQSSSRVEVSPEIAVRIEQYRSLVPAARTATPASHDRMPYRVFLGQVAERLRATYEGLGIPLYYRLRANTLEVYPRPATTTSLHLDVLTAPVVLGLGDEPVFPEVYHRALIVGAIAKAYEDDGNVQQAGAFQARFDRAVASMRLELLGPREEGYPAVVDTF
jgi:phosphoenolpyruvate carboxylase